MLHEIQVNLKAHTTIEEEIFYPAFKEDGKRAEAKMYFEALEEHRAAEDLVLPDLLQTDVGSVEFSGRAKVLKELIEHHAGMAARPLMRLLEPSLRLTYTRVTASALRFEWVESERALRMALLAARAPVRPSISQRESAHA